MGPTDQPPTEMDTTLQGDDPERWGASMANMKELMLQALEAAEVRSVAEVGAFAGDLTEVLVEWAQGAGAKVIAIDPVPQPALLERAERFAELELIAKTSADALRDMPLPDAVVVDGDHNYHTVSEELRWIGERASGAETPLILFHDVLWPHGRRDAYYAPERIPDEYQDEIQEGVGMFPGEPGSIPGGLPYQWAAKQEGGPRNGVLTAIEDFIAEREGLRLAVVPMFYGLGIAWHRDAPWAGAVERLLAPWDRNPVLARLEANRVLHLATMYRTRWDLAWATVRLEELERKQQRQVELLKATLDSRALAVADRTGKFRGGEASTLREQIREAIADAEGG